MDTTKLQLLLPAEVKQLTGLSKATVYRLAANGTIPAVRLGGSVRIPLARLQEWMDRHTTGVGEVKAA